MGLYVRINIGCLRVGK